jgi:preprotein translocase subunit SecA
MNQFQLGDDTPLQGNFLSKSLNSAQEKVESQYYDTRKQLSDYDEIVNTQRKAIFNERKLILGFRSVRAELIFYGEDLVGSLVQELKLMTMKKNYPDKEFDKLNKEISYILNTPYVIVSFQKVKELKLNDLYRIFCNQFWLSYDIKEIEFEMYTPGLIRLLEKSLLLNQIDLAWKTHLEKIDILRDSIGWRSYGQLDPLTEYKNEAFNLFIETTREIKYNSVYNMLKSSFV